MAIAGEVGQKMFAPSSVADGGVSAGALAWVLESLRIGGGADVAPGVTAQELEQFRLDLVQQLRRLALPGP